MRASLDRGGVDIPNGSSGVEIADSFAIHAFGLFSEIKPKFTSAFGAMCHEDAVKYSRYWEKILDDMKGDGFSKHPLRLEYEGKVINLARVGKQLELDGVQKEDIAKQLHQMRRDLGERYKNYTPRPLRDYIYIKNIERHGDELGPTFGNLIDLGKTHGCIIESASRPNQNIDKLLLGFENFLKIEWVGEDKI